MALPQLETIDLGNGQVISYRDAGAGECVLILHGLGGRSESWVPQYEGLSDQYRVIGWDAPGYGGSSELKLDAPNIEDYADLVMRFADALELDRFHLVGHSVGTCIAARVHQTHPGRLLSLTLAEAVIGNGTSPDDEKENMLVARARDLTEMGPEEFAMRRTPNALSPKADPEAVAAAVEFAQGMRVPGYLKLFGALVRANMFKYVEALQVPAMIVAGSDDKSAPEKFVREIAEAFPGIRYEIIDGIGHQIAFEKPDLFLNLLKHHLVAAEAAIRGG